MKILDSLCFSTIHIPIGPTDPEAIIRMIVQQRRQAVLASCADPKETEKALPSFDEHFEQAKEELAALAESSEVPALEDDSAGVPAPQ